MQPITEETAKALLRQITILRNLLEKRKQQWVKVSVITRVTGWDKDRLKRARRNGEIVFRKNKTGIWYDLGSVLPIHRKEN